MSGSRLIQQEYVKPRIFNYNLDVNLYARSSRMQRFTLIIIRKIKNDTSQDY